MIFLSAIALVTLSMLIVGLSFWGVVLPRRLVSFVRGVVQKGGISTAVGFRLILSALLWVTASTSYTPTVFLVLAALAFAAAIGLVFMGKARIMRLMDRVASWPDVVLRLQCVIGIAFGLFLTWSVSQVWVAT